MSSQSRPDELKGSPAYQLWLATNAWQRAVRKALEPLELTHAQFVVLASVQWLSKDAAMPTQADVCRFGALDENMTSQLVRVLSEKGFLTRCAQPGDKRAHGLRLTPSGMDLVELARAEVKPAAGKYFSKLNEDQLTQLTTLLRELNDAHNN
ncbi:MAG: winged helix DNA-binding protein [Armatimonadetes bacterium]|nr:winged helix DNA-binding protein [Armatimonadota bacterium]